MSAKVEFRNSDYIHLPIFYILQSRRTFDDYVETFEYVNQLIREHCKDVPESKRHLSSKNRLIRIYLIYCRLYLDAHFQCIEKILKKLLKIIEKIIYNNTVNNRNLRKQIF